MADFILPENEPQIQPRNPYPYARPGPIPDGRLDGLFDERPAALVARAESSTTASSSSASISCGPNDNSGPCEKYYNADGASNTLPIVLGVVIPLGIAIVILLYLQRRHVRNLRKEDAEDKHKSLDFGLGAAQSNGRKKNGQKAPEMAMADKEMGLSRRDRGLSLDMGNTNPYLLPPGLNQSRESLHSLSRSINTGDDKYRTTTFIPDDGSIRPGSSLRSPIDDSSSTFTGSSSRRFNFESKHNLLHNAQENPSGLPRHDSVSSSRDASLDHPPGPRNPLPTPQNNLLAPTAADAARDSFVSTTSSTGGISALRASNNYLGRFIAGGTSASPEDTNKEVTPVVVPEIRAELPAEEVRSPPPAIIKDNIPHYPSPTTGSHSEESVSGAPNITLSAPEERQPRLPQLSFIDSQGNKQNSLGDDFDTNSGTPHATTTPPQSTAPSTAPSADVTHQEQFPHLPQSSTQENPDHYEEEDDYYEEEELYGDWYDEYEQYSYDPRRSTMGLRPLPPDDPSDNPEDRANRIRSFYKEYFDDSKPQPAGPNGGHYPPQGGYYENYGPDQHYPPRGGTAAGAYGRHRATVSNGSFMSGPRAFSSVSGQYGRPPPRPAPKRHQVPLKTLAVLPTPHLLKDDTFLPIDFAPPKKYLNQRSGTPDSLLGGERPYSPSVRAHVPLASSFDDLAVIPSPHQLRKSATFTALDFAPPKFRSNDTMSETGSIRSNRSGVSAVHAHNIRTGAYRVSRIPKDVGGTRDEFAAALRPQWDLHR